MRLLPVGVLLAGAIAASAVGAWAQGNDSIKARKDLMEGWGRHSEALIRMTRGRNRYNQAQVDAAWADFASGSERLLSLFGEDSKPRGRADDYSASAKIWTQRSGFEAEIAKFAAAVKATQGQSTDAPTLKTNYLRVLDQCNGCHETYRVRNR